MNERLQAAEDRIANLVPGLEYQVCPWGCISNGDRATATGRVRVVDGWPEVEMESNSMPTAWVPAENLAQPWSMWDPEPLLDIPAALEWIATDVDVAAPDAERFVELLRGMAELYRAPQQHRLRVLRTMVRPWA